MNIMHGMRVMVCNIGQNKLALCMELCYGVPQNTITLILKYNVMVYLKPKINKRYAWNKAVMVYPWPKN